MQRRDFLKAAAATAAGASSLNATSLISDNLMSDMPAKMSASHFGAIKGLVKNGKFEGVLDASEIDFYPVSLTQGVVARTYSNSYRTSKCAQRIP